MTSPNEEFLDRPWEEIEHMNKAWGVFSGDQDYTPCAIFCSEDGAEKFVAWHDTWPEDDRYMELHVMPMQRVTGEFWNSFKDVQWGTD